MIWAPQKTLRTILLATLLSTSLCVGIFNTQVSADAVTGADGGDGIAAITEKWLRYRAIAGCYSAQDVGGNNIDKINEGKWFGRNLAADWKTTIGYLNDDGKVSCGDGGMVTNSLKKIGFASNQESFCAMSVAKRDGDKDYGKCMTGSGEFDMDGSRGDQFNSFKSAKAEKISDSASFPYEPTGEILYWVGLQSLKKFCGGERGEKYTDSMAGNIGDAKRKVVVNEVDLATGEVIKYVYNLDRDEGDTVNNIWAEDGQDNTTDYFGDSVVNTKDMKCTDLAKLTWDNDDAFGTYVKKYNLANPEDVGEGLDSGDGSGGSDETTCAVDKIGWIVCPVIEKTGEAADSAFNFLADGFLETDASLVQTDSGTYTAWTKMRDIANVAFVIAFIVIIYSQLTSMGLSNYGVKKLLPKLVAVAILVNSSFFICQILVDVTNIIGFSLKGLLDTIAESIPLSSGGGSSATGDGLGLLALATTILAAAAVVVILLPILGGVVLMAIVTLVTVIIILLLRKALIVLLIFISPIAFVAYLLPNTEKFFTKWKDMFIKLLLVFPIVALLFGAGNLAGRVILAAGTGDSYDSNGGTTDMTMGLVAAGVTVAPLMAVWAVLQGALSAAGAIGGKINNIGGKAASKARARGDNSGISKHIAQQRQLKRAQRSTGTGTGVRSRINRGLNNSTLFNKATRDYGQKRAIQGAALDSKLANEDVENTATLMQKQAGWTAATTIPMAQDELATAIASGDTTRARAAQKILLGSGSKGVEAASKTLSKSVNSGNANDSTVQYLKSDITGAGLKGKDAALDAWSRDNSGATVDSIASRAGSLDGLSDTELAGQSATRISQGGISQARAQDVMDNPAVWGNMSEEKKTAIRDNAAGNRTESKEEAQVLAIQHNTPPPPTPPPVGRPPTPPPTPPAGP